ncbi:GNAT family N-acetyltransferase [Pigmentiphaga litoralis]|uniref:GNAT family N-acetyltransferase n=1 Tax=Pigmentiphaga litoralis TaxID=516702 RepID=UPI00167892E2|nr:GNAT family N-acyltransferase [Pigmentiphaga litoralis]
MLEFSRIEARRPIPDVAHHRISEPAQTTGFAVGLARSWSEVEAAQRLRYEVFTEDMGAIFPNAVNGVDEDRFDAWCEHLIVRELTTGRVVGTYRILGPKQARQAGNYYSESEFDLTGLASIRSELVEFGRSCTHRDYRSGAVIMLLWSGLAEFLRRANYRYVLGCASVSLRDDGATAAGVYRAVAEQLAFPGPLQVSPLHRLPVERLDADLPTRVPPLIKGYLKLGARVCGEPAWDPDFNTADFPMLLSVDTMDDRYRRHFNLAPGVAQPSQQTANSAELQVQA